MFQVMPIDGEGFQTVKTYLVKYILKLILGESTALNVLDSTQVLRHSFAILSSYWLHLLL